MDSKLLKRQERRYRAEWLLFAVVVALVSSLTGYILFEARRDVERQEADRLAVQARVASANLLQQLEGVDRALIGVRDDFFSGIAIPGMQAMTARRLKSLTQALPGMRVMFVLDGQGKVVAANRDDIVGSQLAEREYFTTPRSRPNAETLYVSRPFKSALGAWVTNLTRVLTDADGNFAGIVTAGLDSEHFDVVLGSVLYAPDMRTTLVHGDGLVFLNMPPNPALRGTDVAKPGSFFSRHRESGKLATLLTGRVFATGEDRMVATRTIESPARHIDRPLVVHVSRELGAIYAGWQRQAWFLTTILVLAALGSAGALAITQRHRGRFEALARSAQREREESTRRIRAITDNLPVLISYLDADLKVRFLNRTFNTWAGVDLARSIGRPLIDVIGAKAYAKRADGLRRALAGERVEFELKTVTSGVERDLRNTYVPDFDEHGAVAGVYTLSTDVTALKNVERQLSELARTDPLTGLANRRQFAEKLVEALARGERGGKALALMFLDIDAFKAINDTLGHPAGDEVLKEFARRLQQAVRSTDSVARLAGDEFVVILEGLNERAEAQGVASKILAQVEQPFDIAGEPQTVSTSVGVAYHERGPISPSDLLARADHALYEAKAAGRNTYRLEETLA